MLLEIVRIELVICVIKDMIPDERHGVLLVTMVAKPTYVYTEAAETDATGLPSSNGLLNTTFILRIPKQDILYTPAVSEVLKFAWIQYMSFFIVIGFLLYHLNAFIFRHRVSIRTVLFTYLIMFYFIFYCLCSCYMHS